MIPEYIPVNIPLITAEDIDYVSKAMRETWVSGEGPYVEEFETTFANLCNRRFGIAVANGSVAIDLVVEALELKPGDMKVRGNLERARADRARIPAAPPPPAGRHAPAD